jgi:hypothetical protein
LYLKELKESTVLAVVRAQSEREMFHLQGKLALLETLVDLKKVVSDVQKAD